MTAAVATVARQRVDRIKTGVEVIWSLVVESYKARDWLVLGYSSWDEMCTREFGTSYLRLPREERVETVQSLRDSGLSYPAIAAATGLGYGTVHRAVNGSSGCPDGQPEPEAEEVFNPETGEVIMQIEWVDKPVRAVPEWVNPETGEVVENTADIEAAVQVFTEYVQDATVTGLDGKRYAPSSSPRAPQRKPLTDEFRSVALDLDRVVGRVARLAGDDRFNKNADQISQSYLHDLIRARDALQRVIDQLPVT